MIYDKFGSGSAIVKKSRFQRKGHAFDHGVEEIGFVGEVQIYGPSRHTSAPGNMLKAGPRHTLRQKEVFGCVQQIARGRRIILGSTRHILCLRGIS